MKSIFLPGLALLLSLTLTTLAQENQQLGRMWTFENPPLAYLDDQYEFQPDQLVPQIVSLYRGGIFQLYQYRVYRDIRRVCIPLLQATVFGGDPDNFTYPRYCIEFAFLRAYENGRPANTTTHYFQWKPGGVHKGERVVVSGNPGTTERWFTKAQLELERDIRIPMRIEQLANSLRISKPSEDLARPQGQDRHDEVRQLRQHERHHRRQLWKCCRKHGARSRRGGRRWKHRIAAQ